PLNGLSLRIKDCGFQHDPDVCFHFFLISGNHYSGASDFAAERKSSSNWRLSIGGRKAALKLCSASRRSCSLDKPSDAAREYSVSKSVWNIPGSSVESVTSEPPSSSFFSGWSASDASGLPVCLASAPVARLLVGQFSSTTRLVASDSASAGSCITAIPWPMRSAPSISTASRTDSGLPISPAWQ